MSEMSPLMFVVNATITLMIFLAACVVCALAWTLWQSVQAEQAAQAEKAKQSRKLTSAIGGALEGYVSDTTARSRAFWSGLKALLLAFAMLGGLALAGHWLNQTMQQAAIDQTSPQEPTK
jgi:predicted negative regulator of RcsB-dependent stress response